MPLTSRDVDDLFARSIEDRAVLAVVRLLLDEGRSVGAVRRPERDDAGSPGRKPDAVLDVDGAPLAVEVVRYGPTVAAVAADSRVRRLEAPLRQRVRALLGGTIEAGVAVSLDYDAAALGRVGRRSMELALERLASAAAAAVRSGVAQPVDTSGLDWLRDAQAAPLPGRPEVHLAASRSVDMASRLSDLVEQKGGQHSGYAVEAVLALVPQGGELEPLLEEASTRPLPWRLVVVRLDRDLAEPVDR